ncbi:hypothetical protein [Maricaulis sp.]|uniref:hypothetical protein n=2 Tax=Alphaproteobacteria TaxID=28211 RepID=UPI003297A32A
MPKNEKQAQQEREPNTKPSKVNVPVVSAIGPHGELIETIFDTDRERPKLAIWKNLNAQVLDSYTPDSLTRYVPFAGAKALVEHNVVQFAQGPMEYGTTCDLVDAIRAYIHKYVDVSEAFERLAANYVLLTWVHDRFNELPYLRRRGDYGTGKTRFLTVVGSICFKPIFAGGASTTSPIFHLLNQIGGTLVIDEADFRFSDESALIAKILNAGNVKGYPVLRSETTNGKDFRPRAFKVFGPKLVGMRGRYDDPALESRFLTETSSNPTDRQDVPINLPSEQAADAAVLRDKLLLYRFRNFARLGAPDRLDAAANGIEPRMHQILAPLMSVAEEETDRQAILAHASAAQEALREARGQTIEAEVLTVIRKLMKSEQGVGVRIQDIASAHGRAYLDAVSKPLAPRAMGDIVRTKLNLKTRKSHGVFIVSKTQHGTLERLYERYSVTDEDVARLADLLGETTHMEFGDIGGG